MRLRLSLALQLQVADRTGLLAGCFWAWKPAPRATLATQEQRPNTGDGGGFGSRFLFHAVPTGSAPGDNQTR